MTEDINSFRSGNDVVPPKVQVFLALGLKNNKPIGSLVGGLEGLHCYLSAKMSQSEETPLKTCLHPSSALICCSQKANLITSQQKQ